MSIISLRDWKKNMGGGNHYLVSGGMYDSCLTRQSEVAGTVRARPNHFVLQSLGLGCLPPLRPRMPPLCFMPAAHVMGCSFRNTREGLTPVILLEAPLYQKASCFPRSVLTSQWPKHHTAHLSYKTVQESKCLVLSTFVVGGT